MKKVTQLIQSDDSNSSNIDSYKNEPLREMDPSTGNIMKFNQPKKSPFGFIQKMSNQNIFSNKCDQGPSQKLSSEKLEGSSSSLVSGYSEDITIKESVEEDEEVQKPIAKEFKKD